MRLLDDARWRTFAERGAGPILRDIPLSAFLLLIVASALTLAVGGLAGVAVPAIAAMIVWAARRAAEPTDRTWLVAATVSLFALRAIFAIAIHLFLVTKGTQGALFLDDAGYAQLATAVARNWHGEPLSPLAHTALSDPSIGNLYVRMAAGVLWLLGGEVIGLKLVNTGLAVLSAIAIYRVARNAGLPGPRLAALIVLVFPSLVLWSALALKDAYVIFFAAVALWAVTEIVRGGRLLPWLTLGVIALLAIQDVRRYVFLIMCVMLPIGLLIGVTGSRRVPVALVGTVVATLLIILTPAASLLRPDIFSWTAAVRSAMAEGAGSAFVEPPPVARAELGQRFIITTPGQTADPGSTPRLIEVPPGTVLVSISGQRPGERSSAFVRPGDVVVISGAVSSPRVTTLTSGTTGATLEIRSDRVNVLTTPSPEPSTSEELTMPEGLQGTLRHIPVGLLFVLFAPFPILARSLNELAAAPEMLLWYLTWPLVGIALVSMVRERRTEYAYGVLLLLAIGLVLVVVEGNVGTLVRHRTMLLPFVAVLIPMGVARLPWRHPYIQRLLT